MADVTFLVCGQTIKVGDVDDFYNSFRHIFYQAASETSQIFAELYDSYGDIDTVVNKAFDDGLRIVIGVINRFAIKGFLIHQKIYDIDGSRFFHEYYLKYFDFVEVFQNIVDQHTDIVLTQKQQDEYREMRKQFRSRWVGGGFGVSGAIKGAIKAGAMNLATDAWHGFWDSVEKGFENADIRSRKAALYKKSRSELTAEMFESVLRIHFAVLEVLEQHKSKIDINCLAPGAKDKARAIVNKFDKMSKEEVLAILPQVFLLNPYDERLYKKLYSLFGDKDGGIEKAANYFDVDTSFIAKEKEALAERLFADVKGELGKSEQSALEAKKKFELAIASNNVNDTESARKNLKTIESRLQDYDVKARTVEGEVFSSRQEAENVRQAIAEFERAFDVSVYTKSEERARMAMKELMSYDTKYSSIAKRVEAKKKEIEKVLQEFDELNRKARTITYRVNTRTFDTKEEADKAHLEAYFIDYMLEGLNYEESEADAKEALQKLQKHTPDSQVVFDDYVNKVKDILRCFVLEASSVSIGEKSIVLDRKEAEKVKAMPEFNELVSSWDKYKIERTDVALNHIAELLGKMPAEIRSMCYEMFSTFEAEQKETVAKAKIRISWKSLLFMAAAIVVLIVIAPFWHGWGLEWLGMKGVAAALMFIIPFIGMLYVPGGPSTDENPNLSHEFFFFILMFSYWEAAILTLTLPSWDSYSHLWQTLIFMAALFMAFMIKEGIQSIPALKKKATENAAKNAVYLSDFEQLSSQSEEYRAYRATHMK